MRGKELLKKAMKAIVRNDISDIEHILLSMSTITEPVNHVKLRSDIQRILDKNANEDIKNKKEKNKKN